MEERNMKVFVLHKNGKPLMPTNPAKAKHLLKAGKAKVVKRTPFTIQLTIDTGENTQEVNLGVDAGSKVVGLSATTEKEVLFESEMQLRNDIAKLLADRSSLRRIRRNKKTRYRQARFLNRLKGKGWIAPSIQHKIDGHSKAINLVKSLLPISKVIIEVAQFDIQKIKNPSISGVEYQQGEQLDFWNVREYVLFRDEHQCKGKLGCKNQILNVHHIESRRTGGDSPENLIILCEECHKAYHAGTLKLNLKRSQSFRDATFMGIMRWALYNKEKEIFNNTFLTYGYITKHIRIQNKLEKSHAIDARCISKNPNAKSPDVVYRMKQVRGQNRQLHKCTINKGGIRKTKRLEKYVFGFKLFDKVKYNNQECFIFGRRTKGSFNIRLLNGEVINAGISYKKLKLLEKSSSILTEKAA
jgi:N6-L-threonylcarbamoyladenine synthase